MQTSGNQIHTDEGVPHVASMQNNQTVAQMLSAPPTQQMQPMHMQQTQSMQYTRTTQNMHHMQQTYQLPQMHLIPQAGIQQMNYNETQIQKRTYGCSFCLMVTFLVFSLITIGLGQTYASAHHIVEPYNYQYWNTVDGWAYYGATSLCVTDQLQTRLQSKHETHKWKKLCKHKMHDACDIETRGIVWNVLNSFSIIGAAVAVFINVLMSRTQNQDKFNTTWSIRMCLAFAAILQIVSVMVWEINTPIRDSIFTKYIFTDPNPNYFWCANVFNILNFVGFLAAEAMYKQ